MLSDLMRRYGREFDNLVRDFEAGRNRSVYVASCQYPVDVVEIKKDGIADEYALRIALAGIPKDNIEIEVKDDVLTVTVAGLDKQSGVRYLRDEIDTSSMRQDFGLAGLDAKGITSSYTDGLLEIRIPVAEERKARRIKIG